MTDESEIWLNPCEGRWNRYLSWEGRYDFVVAKEPLGEEYATPVIKYRVDHQSSPLASVRSKKVFFTGFIWDDEDGTQHEISRQDLCTAFEVLLTRHELVAKWWYYLLDIHYSIKPIFKHDTILRRRAWEVMMMLEVCKVERENVAEQLSFYLNALSDYERQGRVPRAWRRYTGANIDLTSAVNGPDPLLQSTCQHRFSRRLKDDTICDFGFRLAQLVKLTNFADEPEFNALLDEAIEIYGVIIGKRPRPMWMGPVYIHLILRRKREVTPEDRRLERDLLYARNAWDIEHGLWDRKEPCYTPLETRKLFQTRAELVAYQRQQQAWYRFMTALTTPLHQALLYLWTSLRVAIICE